MYLKRFCKLIVILIFISISFIVVHADTNQIGYVNANTLNIRETPDTDSGIISKLTNGEVIVITQTQNDWLKIKYNDMDGWVFAKYVDIQDIGNETIIIKMEGKVNAQGVNIRNEASLEGIVIVRLDKNESVGIISEDGDWYKILYKDKIAYIDKSFIAIKNEFVGNGIINSDNINIRDKADISSVIIDTVGKDLAVNILVNFGNWYKISYEDKNGWISKEYVDSSDIRNVLGYVNASDVNLRSDPEIGSKILDKLEKNKIIRIFCRYGDWYRIQSDDEFGWIHVKLVNIDYSMSDRGYVKDIYPDIELKEVSSKIKEMIEYAKRFLGVQYVWGGESPNGFDCSGLTLYIYKHIGVSLPHKASLQAKEGIAVSRSNLQPGDLIFFETNPSQSGIDHTGIYIGNGQFIHAASSRTGRSCVNIGILNTGYYNYAYVSARRIINE